MFEATQSTMVIVTYALSNDYPFTQERMLNLSTYTVDTSNKSRLVQGRVAPHETALKMSPLVAIPSF